MGIGTQLFGIAFLNGSSDLANTPRNTPYHIANQIKVVSRT